MTVAITPTGEPLDPETTNHFVCLQQTGNFCVEPSLVLTPFIQPLPIPPRAQPVPQLVPPPDPSAHQLWAQHPPVNLYDVHIKVAKHKFHPDLPPSTIWGFNGLPMGATYYARYGEPYLVRFHNDLPNDGDGTGFGKPEVTIHLHNAHTASESDGFPGDFFPSGVLKDNHYTMFLAGQDERETLGTLWYHDHRADFTAQNVYKGLAGFTFYFDERDSGDENDPNPEAFRLPSGEYDVPLLLADKKFTATPDHSLYLDVFNTDGFLGDQYAVNMAIQPYFEVAQRKYRFRVLNIGPSRFYRIALSNGDPMTMIANDGNLLERPVQMPSVRITVAERVDVVVDFSQVPLGSELYLLNLEDQISGKGPTGETLPLRNGTKMMKFIVNRQAPDPSQIPAFTREMPTITEAEIVRTREFVFDNENGIWTINGKPFDFNRADTEVKQGTAERWVLRNTTDDWEHPVHIHMEEHHIESRNGKPPAPHERGRKDVTVLGPGDTVVVVIRFRDFTGRYPIHCHNTVHEDHAMMSRWDLVK
ncbi:MAG: multicopper oxidase domain-containing protein [Planctomycetota bacterium]